MVFSQQVNIVYEFQKKYFPSVSVPSECAISGVCSFNANELLPIDQ